MAQAYQRAGADPADIQYIEGQGTGTAAGDSAELAAFSHLRRDTRVTAALGAASASIGYARAAAGIASLIRTAAAMAAWTIPPGPGCARPHPLIASGHARLRLPGRAEPWPGDNPGTARPTGAVGTAGLVDPAGVTASRRPRLAAVHSLGTADPAVLAGRASLRDAEGMHVVLRRDAEGDRWTGRRRRAAQARPQEAMAQEYGATGRHTAPRGTAAAPLAGTGQAQVSALAGRTETGREGVAAPGGTRPERVTALGGTRPVPGIP